MTLQEAKQEIVNRIRQDSAELGKSQAELCSGGYGAGLIKKLTERHSFTKLEEAEMFQLLFKIAGADVLKDGRKLS